MSTQMFMSIMDYPNETGSLNIHLPEITVLNFTGVTQDLDEIADAIQAVVLGNTVRLGFTRTYDDSDAINPDPVTNTAAQREQKWLVTYKDVKKWLDAAGTIANGAYRKKFTFEIPCADLSLLQTNSDQMNVTAGAGLALVTALEANAKSPYNKDAPSFGTDTEYIKVLSIRHVGRNT